MRRQNRSCTPDNSKGGERLDKPNGWDWGFYVMKTIQMLVEELLLGGHL